MFYNEAKVVYNDPFNTLVNVHAYVHHRILKKNSHMVRQSHAALCRTPYVNSPPFWTTSQTM